MGKYSQRVEYAMSILVMEWVTNINEENCLCTSCLYREGATRADAFGDILLRGDGVSWCPYGGEPIAGPRSAAALLGLLGNKEENRSPFYILLRGWV